MFKFDFQVDDIENNAFLDKETKEQKRENSTDTSSIDWYDSEQIFPTVGTVENLDIFRLNSTHKVVNGTSITHLLSGFLLEDIKDNDNIKLDIKRGEDQHSDLIPGVYEGGAKVWECTEDLLSYLSENYAASDWNGVQVLDLGCGAGILGIYAFLNGAKVTFQDYNKDVLENITIPNVLLNFESCKENGAKDESYDVENIEGKVKFYSGDWEKWVELTKNRDIFDIILTSETIYNPRNQHKLLNCLYDKLKLNGKALVAAKVYYFGVGGSLRQFEKLVEKDNRFKYRTVWQSNEGINREIIELVKVN